MPVTDQPTHPTTIVREPTRRRWTTVDNRSVEDDRLSFRALGVLVYLLSRPDHWRANVGHLCSTHKEGRESVRTALRELEATGYLTRRWVRSEGSDTPVLEYIIHEVPVAQEPACPGSGNPENRVPENRPAQDPASSKELMEELDTEKSKEPPPHPPLPVSVERTDRPGMIVFEAWKVATGRNGNTVLTDKRKKVIREALRLYPLEDVVDAVRGWRFSPHHCGENDRGTTYNDIELLLRDARQIEKFRDLERNGPPVRRGGPKNGHQRTMENLDSVFERLGLSS